MFKIHDILCCLFYPAILLFSSSSLSSEILDAYEKSSNKSLQEILEDTEFAITEYNLRIVERLHIGEAIRERGSEEFPDYEIILYCNLTFAEKMLELKPEMINTCPGRITIRGRGNPYIISAQLWPEDPDNEELNMLIRNMNSILIKIVDHAALHWE